MRAGLLRLRALAGVLGLTIDSVTCYTAYQSDALAKEPAMVKLPLGDLEVVAPEDAEDLETIRRQYHWDSEQAHLDDFEGPVSHRKIPCFVIGERGVGACQVTAA